MIAGLMMAVCWTHFVIGYLYDWAPQPRMTIATITLGVVGFIWLYDEIREMRY